MLNASRCLHRGRVSASSASWHPVVSGGQTFLLEPRTLALVPAGEDLPPINAAPAFAAPSCFGDCKLLVLNLTRACNLRCRYCFVREGGQAPAAMPRHLALAAVDALFPENRAGSRIGFFGGEPLLARPILCAVVEHARRRLPSPAFSITTNGTLVTDEVAGYLADNQFSIILSIDGSPHRHDALRPRADGSGSHHAALAALDRLAAHGLRPSLRSTFVKPVADDNCSPFSLVDELEVLNDLCDEGYGGGVSIEPASLTESCAFGAYALTREDLLSLEPQYQAAAEWFIARARAGKRARFHHLVTVLERLVNRRPVPVECGAGNGYLTVAPDGTIHACHREKSPVGRLVDGAPVFDPRREAWLDNRLHTHARCPDCPYRYLCGGGCRLDHLDRSGDLRVPDGLGCELTRIRVAMAVRCLAELGPEACARAGGFRFQGSGA